ncbi:TELO2-interacting protein 1 homolog [Mytilus californianus]|uniref:TELO2-interacting protein 1 homolog n=1 Tax=Mytilus californianus TaxID=6549 RepID=UPI0022477447|nr:TELO2-interacting protein 1 homolog [Mytilus californianus]
MACPNAERKKVFDKIRPLCVQLTKEHTRVNVQAVNTALTNVDRTVIQDLQEYLLFPFRLILKQDKKYPDELYVDVFTSIEKVLSQTRVSQWEMFQDIFNTCCLTISSPAEVGKVKPLSEELKTVIVQTLMVLVRKSEYSMIQSLYAPWSLPFLGHAVSILLNLAEKEKSRALKIKAMECLIEISQVDGKYCSKVKTMLGDTFASFLPGVSITLCQVITGDSKQGQTVIITALKTWASIVTMVMDDKLIEEAQIRNRINPNSKLDGKLQNLIVKRNKEWVELTGSKFTVLVKQIAKVKSHSSWKVRQAMVEWAARLLEHCSKSLKDCIPTILEVLVGLIGDEYSHVALYSRKVLESFSSSHLGHECRPLVEMLEENLHQLTVSLPRLIRSSDESQKLGTASLLSGYIALLGPNVNSLLRSSSHLKRLSLSLIQVLELDCSDVKIIEERTHLIGHGASAVNSKEIPDILQPKKYFRHFHDKKIYHEFRNVCRLLGYYGDINLLTDHFLDIFHDTILHKMQATLIINEMVMGAAGHGVHRGITKKKDREVQHKITVLEEIIKMLIEEYFSPINFHLITNASHDSAMSTPETRLLAINLVSHDNTVNSFNRNIIQICLYLEGIGYFAKVLGKRFCPFLIQTLYPLLEKLGDDTAFISSTAYLSLCDICSACSYGSIDELLKQNADYLVNAISLRLRHFDQNKQSPLVLKVILQYSTVEILPLIDDTIQEVLSSLDDFYDDQAALFMGVLNELVKAVSRWFPCLKCKVEETQADNLCVSLIDELLEYCKTLRVSEGQEEEVDESHDQPSQEEDEDSTDPDKKPPLPKHVVVVKEVMTRSKHLLSSKSPRLRLLVLDTIGYSCQALSSHTDELLPLIHELWPSYRQRFIDGEKLVVRRALETLVIMSECTGDFIKRRTVTDVFPKLINFLDKQAQISVQTGTAYLHTVAYKLQHSILTNIGIICDKLTVGGNDLEEMMCTCSRYLSARQPHTLQQVSISLCRTFYKLDPDRLWLLLCDMACPVEYIPPSPCLKNAKFLTQPLSRNEYTDNVKIVFVTLYDNT